MYQGHTPNTLMNIQRHLNHRMTFHRTERGNPFFTYKGKSIMFSKQRGFKIHLENQQIIRTKDFWQALEIMR